MTSPSSVGEEPKHRLEELCSRSMLRVLPGTLQEQLVPLVQEIQGRHPGSLATLLYGSCLRAGHLEGVPDFILVVEDYERAYSRRWLRIANRWIPPNVFPLFSSGDAGGPIRAKYAVVSVDDLRRETRTQNAHCFLWARLCQPFSLLDARDDATRETIATCAANAATTMIAMALPRVADSRRRFAFDAGALWTAGFQETYRCEWRFEPRDRSLQLVADDPSYYHDVAEAVLARLESAGALRRDGDSIGLDDAWARRQRLVWVLRRPLGKALAALRLIKSALTFGDWVPYALWKMERHTGVRLEASAAQRRHPFLLGWPLILRALRERLLR